MALCIAVPSSAEESESKTKTTSDLMMADLKGPVRYAVTYSYYSKSDDYTEIDTRQGQEIVARYTYKEDGTFDEKSDDNNIDFNFRKVTRNKQGQITETKAFIQEYNQYITDTYQYNANGSLKEYKSNGIEGRSVQKYTYLDDGTNCGCEILEYGEGSKTLTTISYTVLKKDSHGNWTRRLVTKGYDYGKDDGTDNYNETGDSECLIETRTIAYY